MSGAGGECSPPTPGRLNLASLKTGGCVLAAAAEVWARSLSPAIRAFIRQKEHLLFEQFPQFDRQADG